MFVDHTKIEVQAGKGGDGAISFRREKFVPLGGPAGGDGGAGGSIIFKVDEGLRTLMDFRFRRKFKAQNGEKGMNKAMYGKKAPNLIVKVPAGTSVYNDETNELIGDLTENGQELVVAKGGRGGRGNIHFASAKNPAPEIAENGEPGQFVKLRLELKLIADVGLVGFPSVGKSTLLSVVTAAKPKIAAYQFTTLTPNLGMVQLADGRDFSLADLPGIIEGAANGVGLGLQFLRHIERTKLLLHLVEMDPENGRDPYQDYQAIRQELASYGESVANKPELIVATKMDLPEADKRLAEFKKKLNPDVKIYPVASLTHQGIDDLMSDTATVLDQLPKEDDVQVADEKAYKFTPEAKDKFVVKRVGEHEFVIHGEKVERVVQMTNTTHQEGEMRLARQLKALGIDEALKAAGAVEGDEITIADLTFEFVE